MIISCDFRKSIWIVVFLGMLLAVGCGSDDGTGECECTSTITEYPNGMQELPTNTSTLDLGDACELDGQVYSSTDRRLLKDPAEIEIYSLEGPFELTEVDCR